MQLAIRGKMSAASASKVVFPTSSEASAQSVSWCDFTALRNARSQRRRSGSDAGVCAAGVFAESALGTAAAVKIAGVAADVERESAIGDCPCELPSRIALAKCPRELPSRSAQLNNHWARKVRVVRSLDSAPDNFFANARIRVNLSESSPATSPKRAP